MDRFMKILSLALVVGFIWRQAWCKLKSAICPGPDLSNRTVCSRR